MSSKSPAPFGTMRPLEAASVDVEEHLHKVHVEVRRPRRQAHAETPTLEGWDTPTSHPWTQAQSRDAVLIWAEPPPELPAEALTMQLAGTPTRNAKSATKLQVAPCRMPPDVEVQGAIDVHVDERHEPKLYGSC